jgi:hypothetical protein
MLELGLIPNLDIRDVISSAPEILSGVSSVQMSVIDSTRPGEIREVTDPRWRAEHQVQVVGADIAVSLAAFLRFVDDPSMMSGFDEVWFLTGPPRAERPDLFRLTSDRDVGSLPADQLWSWMDGAGSTLGLGDGAGVNYATINPAIAGVMQTLRA